MADDRLVTRMFLILHDPFTGKPEIASDLLRRGLVAAVLAGLIMARRIGMENDRVVAAASGATGHDEIDDVVIERLASHADALTVRTWGRLLGDQVYELVAHAVVDAGVVGRRRGGRQLIGRRPDRFPARELIRAARPRLRLEHMLRTPHEMDAASTAFAAVAGSLQADRLLDVDGDRAAVRAAVSRATGSLPIDLRSLVSSIRAPDVHDSTPIGR